MLPRQRRRDSAHTGPSREQVRFEDRAYYVRNTGRYSLPGSFLFPPHYHDAIEVIAMPGGVGGSVTAGGRMIALTGAHFIAVPPGVIHAFDLRSEHEKPFISLQIDSEWATRALSAFTGSEEEARAGLSHLTIVDGARASTLYKSLLGLSGYALDPAMPHFSGSVEDAASDLMIVASILGAMVSLQKAEIPRNIDQSTKSAIDFIEQHSAENLSLDQITAQCSLSKFHLCRSFKAQTGWTIRDYLNHRRISHARVLFDAGERNVSTVAYACGFADPSHFTKVFARYAGVRPKTYVLGRGMDGGADGGMVPMAVWCPHDGRVMHMASGIASDP